MKKYKWLIIIGVLVIAGIGVWFFIFKTPEDIIVLQTEKVQYGAVSISVTATGTLQPVDTVAVGSQISGTVKTVYADFNSPVKKGQLLAQIDKSLTQAQVDQYSASLQQAQGNVVFQKSNYDRQNKLYATGAISKADLETAVYQYKSARENVNSISAQLRTAQKNLSLSTPTLFSIAKDLTKMQVQASVDEADIGNVKTGQRAVFSVDAFPADTFSGTVKEIRLRATVSANVVTYVTIIDAPNADLKLKPGMTASITIYTKEVNNTLLIPSAALAFTPDSLLKQKFHLNNVDNAAKRTGNRPAGSKPRVVVDSGSIQVTRGRVWVKKDSVTIIRVPVTTGLDDKTAVQVISGLKEGDEVITGYKKLLKKEAAQATKSPFMPSRGGGGRRPN